MDNNNKLHSETVDVVISGLGPTGATLAHLLGKRGLSVIVLEREPTFYGNARAVYTDDECMRIMQSAGVADELAADMQIDTPAQWTFADGRVLGQYWQLKRPFGWPVINFLYQPWLETRLTELLQRYPNVQIRRGRELTAFEQNSDWVTITHQATRTFRFSESSDARSEHDIDLDPQAIRARYLVGADGGRSTVRESLGIKMDGKNFPEPWLVVDLELKDGEEALRHIPYFNFVCDPVCPTVSCPQPGRFHRFEFMLMPGQTKEYMEDPATVRKLISRHVDPDKFEIKRRLVYTFNALVAQEWRRGRVLLAGDAAHMTPQFMGQGMSSGVRDAYNLAWKLDSVLRGRAAEALLDTYGRERYHHAKAMIDISVVMKDFVSMAHPLKATLRNFTARTLQATPIIGKWIREGGFKPTPTYKSDTYLGIARRNRRSVEGKMIPQPHVRTFKGKRVLLDSLLGDDFALIGLGVNPQDFLNGQSRAVLAAQGVNYLSLFPFGGRPQGKDIPCRTPAGLVEVEEVGEEMLKWFKRSGAKHNAVAIIRPDKFAFAVLSGDKLNAAIEELGRQIGWSAALIGSTTEPRPMRKSA